MAKVRNKRNSGLADKVHNKRKTEINKKKLNPFEVHINREKLKVLGQKTKHDRGLPGVSRAKAIQKRKETLGTEMKLMNKTNAFIDRRIGEKNNELSSEDRIIARFAAERAKQHSKKNIYNLADDEILTHRGQTLEQIEKFDDPRSSDEEDDDGKKFGGLDYEFVSEGHFGGGVLSKSESRDGAKSHKDLIEQLIAESKKRKAEKQKEKEQTLDLTEKLDSEWKDLQPVVMKKPRIEEESIIDKLLGNAEKGLDYDKMMRELRFEKRGTPSDGLKSDEQQAKEEREKLAKLELEREKRMLGEDGDTPTVKQAASKHRSADDLDDNFDLEDEHDFMLAYDKDGNPLMPEHILKANHVPKQNGQFKDTATDSSSDDDDEEEDDESDADDNSEKSNSVIQDDKNEDKYRKNKDSILFKQSSDEEEENDDKEEEKDNDDKKEDDNDDDNKSDDENELISKKDKIKSENEERQLNGNSKKEEKILKKTPKAAEKSESEEVNSESEEENSEKEESEDDESDSYEKVKGEDFSDLKVLDVSDKESDDEEFGDEGDKIKVFFDSKTLEGFNLKELLTGKTPSQQSNALQKLIKTYDPSLAENNKESLSRLFAHLLQYINDVFSNLKQECDVIKSFLIFNKLAPYIYDLAQTNKVSTKKYLVEVIKEKYEEYNKKPKRIPDLDTLIFFKLVSLIYPTSDFKHPITTPCLIFMSDILTKSKFQDGYSISRGLFITSLILEYTVLSKRFIPSSINFIRGILFLTANTSILNHIEVIPPFSIHKDEKILTLENDCSKMASDSKMAAKDLVTNEISDDFKIRCLVTSLAMLKELFNNLNDLEAQECIFKAHIQLLGKIDLEYYPKIVRDKVNSIEKYMKQNLETKTYTPLCKEKKKLKLLRLYEPDVQEVFTGSKNSKLSREKVEHDKLKHKYKKAMKGALREIRRDKSFIASVKIRQKIQSDNLRKEKVKQIYKDAAIQQGELNQIKRMK